MYLPDEILLHIASCAAEVLPLTDALRMRFVCTFFATEIWNVLLVSSLVSPSFLDSFATRVAYDKRKDYLASWKRSPTPVKLAFLLKKAKQYPGKNIRYENVFSISVHEMLESEPRYRYYGGDTALRGELMERLVDGMQASWPSRWMRCMFNFDKYEWFRFRKPKYPICSNGLPGDLLIGLTCSAVRRNNIAELRWMLEQGVDLSHHCNRIGRGVLSVLAEEGTKEAVETLMLYAQVERNNLSQQSISKGIREAAVRDNLSMDVMAAWKRGLLIARQIQHPLTSDSRIDVFQEGMWCAVEAGNISLVDFLYDQICEAREEGEEKDRYCDHLYFDMLTLSIKKGKIDLVEHLLSHWKSGRIKFNPDNTTSRSPLSLINTAVQYCHPVEVRGRILKTLLENGIPPDLTSAASCHQTALQILLSPISSKKDTMDTIEVDLVMLLVEYGADANRTRAPDTGKTDSDSHVRDNITLPLLHRAVMYGGIPLTKMLLRQGDHPTVDAHGMPFWKLAAHDAHDWVEGLEEFGYGDVIRAERAKGEKEYKEVRIYYRQWKNWYKRLKKQKAAWKEERKLEESGG